MLLFTELIEAHWPDAPFLSINCWWYGAHILKCVLVSIKMNDEGCRIWRKSKLIDWANKYKPFQRLRTNFKNKFQNRCSTISNCRECTAYKTIIKHVDILQYILYWYPACFKMLIQCGCTAELPIKCCIPLLNVHNSPV